MITASQIRAARGLINWSQKDLGRHACLSQAAIANIENDNVNPTMQSMDAIREALELAGLEFIDGGVRRRPDLVDTIAGKDYAIKIMDTVYDSLRRASRREYLITGVSFTKADMMLKESIRRQVSRLQAAGMRARILVTPDTRQQDLIGPAEWHRRLPVAMKKYATPCFVFDDYYGVSLRDQKQVLVMRNFAVMQDQRQKFEFFWQHGEVFNA